MRRHPFFGVHNGVALDGATANGAAHNGAPLFDGVHAGAAHSGAAAFGTAGSGASPLGGSHVDAAIDGAMASYVATDSAARDSAAATRARSGWRAVKQARREAAIWLVGVGVRRPLPRLKT